MDGERFFLGLMVADDSIVLLLLLRSRLHDQDLGRRDHHCGQGGRDGVDGGDSALRDGKG